MSGLTIVTGGAGFIGSALVWGLNQRNQDNILIVDRLDQSEKWRNLPPLRFADYLDADDFARRITTQPHAFGKIASVFHLGACSSTTETDSAFLMRNNFEYSKVAAQWALGQGARFVYASSAATYGAIEETVNDEVALHSLRPLNAYAYSKHAFDLWAAKAGVLDRIVGLKYFNVFGPNENHKGEMRSVVHKSFPTIRDTGKVLLFKSHRPEFNDGEQARDFLYVKDAVSMTLHLAAHPRAGGIYNVGGGAASTWIELVTPIFEALNLPVDIEFIDMPESLRARYQYRTCASITRLRGTGYTASITPLRDAVIDYVRNFLIPGRRLGDS